MGTVVRIDDEHVTGMGVERVVRTYFALVNAGDFAAAAALFAAGAELRAPGVSVRIGRDEIERYFGRALRIYKEHHDEPLRVVDAGGTATVEVRFTGRLATGDRVTFDAVDVFDLDHEGRIARLSSWYDSHDVRTRLRMLRARALILH